MSSRQPSTTQYGLTLSSEEHGPMALADLAVTAEEAGFDFCSISDHYHPWIEAQGHSPFVWAVLGAVAARTAEVQVAVGVTCPIGRIHPAVIAEAAATTSLLLNGRFVLGVGTGEALNEHILGDRWPPPELRRARLEEAMEIMRRLWTGDTVDHHGEAYTVENARLFDPPDEPVPVIVSGFGTAAAELAARLGDGLWGHGSDADAVTVFTAAGGRGPRYAELHVCVGADVESCREMVGAVWPNGAIPGQLSQDLPTWTHFEQAASLVGPVDAAASVALGPDPGPIVEAVHSYIENGFDHIYFHQIGPHQDAFLDLWTSDLSSALPR